MYLITLSLLLHGILILLVCLSRHWDGSPWIEITNNINIPTYTHFNFYRFVLGGSGVSSDNVTSTGD